MMRNSFSPRPCLTVLWHRWRTSSTSSSSTSSSCSSLPSSLCNFLRGSFSTAPTVPRTQKKNASKTQTAPLFWVSCLWSAIPRCNPVASFTPGDTTLIMGRTRRRWREESGGDMSFTTITWCGLCWLSSPFLQERAGLSECQTSSCSAALSLFSSFTPAFFSGCVQIWPLMKETYQMWFASQWFMNSFYLTIRLHQLLIASVCGFIILLNNFSSPNCTLQRFLLISHQNHMLLIWFPPRWPKNYL